MILGWVLFAACAAPALRHLVLVVRLYLARFDYPWDMEWLEGHALYQAYRHMKGLSTYAPPANGYLPLFHPPGYPLLLAGVGKVTGLTYGVARSVTMAFFVLAMALTVRVLAERDERGSRALGLTAGALAVGVAAAGTPLFEGFYDLVREDCMAWALCMVAAVLAEERRPKVKRLLALAAISTIAIYTRLLTVFLIAWIHLFVLVRNRRAGTNLALYTTALSAVVLAALQLKSKGWFWVYTIGLLGGHEVLRARFIAGAWRLFDFAPYLAAMPVVFVALAVRRRLSQRTMLWFGLLVAAIPAALLPYAKVGGFANDFMPFALLTGPAALLLARDMGRAFERHPRIGRGLRYVLFVALALFLARRSWSHELEKYTPTTENRLRAIETNAMISKLEGGVIIPRHPFVPIQNGHDSPQYSDMTILDAYWGGLPGLSLGPYLDRGRARYALLTRTEQILGMREIVARYEYDREITSAPTTQIGEGSRLTLMLRWQDPEKNLRVLFDFEDPALPGWLRSGGAWETGTTTANPQSQQPLHGVIGQRTANSLDTRHGFDLATGILTSPTFTIDRDRLAFRIGGGGSVHVELVVGGRVVTSQGIVYRNYELLVKVALNVERWRGQTAFLRLIDNDAGPWGHLLVDHVVLYDRP
ncbi:MAG: hypothetical protein KIT84_04615 [Labilithrix sp.]|nr:hypothetical protein [Labilithrix sp.]MCW5810269.1 hypothetical protein [Labilithrix sp.]